MVEQIAKTTLPKIVLPTMGADGLVRIDGVVLGRFVAERGTLEVKDRDRMRSQCRGSFFVEVRLVDLAGLIRKAAIDGEK